MSNSQGLINNVNGLYGLTLKRLAECKVKGKEIIPFPKIFQKLGSSFCISKPEVWSILFILRDLGFIEIIAFHGCKINEKRREGKKE